MAGPVSWLESGGGGGGGVTWFHNPGSTGAEVCRR